MNDLRVAALPEGIVSFLLTDIEGSTALLRRLGASYDRMLEEHHAIVRGHLSARGGTEVRVTGDGFIFAFTDSAAAMAGAVEAQRALVAHTWPEGEAVRVRFGLHRGDARLIDGEYVSLALHQAVRICAAANGGQIVASPDFVQDIGATDGFIALVSIGAFFVRDFEGPVELVDVRHPDIPAAVAPPRVPPASVHNLPPQRTTFVGRSVEVGEIGKMIDTAGLVTLVGPGGVGKTRLATETALARAGEYENGVWLVQLQSATTGADVAPVIARALGVADRAAASTLDAVVDHLADGPWLLVFDNCEHVIDECAVIVDTVLARCANVRVLATSRESLQLSAEHVYRVEPLAVPALDSSAGDIAAASAVELFVQRARQVDRGFELDEATAPVVAEICRGLDGIPLAIELAAGRAGRGDVGALVDELAGAGLLDVRRRGGDERQRTLRDAIRWSYELLSDAEQRLFRRAAPFRGGFTSEAVSAVAGEDAGALVSDLVGRSLVEPHPDSDPPRFRLLEPVRHFAADRLGAEDDVRAVRHGFVAWCASYADAAHALYGSARQEESLRLIDTEYENVRVAFETGIEDGEYDLAARIARDSMVFCAIRGLWREGRERCVRALDFELDDHLRAQVLLARAGLEQNLGEAEAAREAYSEATDLYEKVGDQQGLAACVTAEASEALRSGDRDRALVLYRRALDAHRSIGYAAGAARCLADIGLLLMRDDRDAARTSMLEALAAYEEVGHSVGVAGVHNLLGQLAYLEDDLDEAEARFTDARDLAAEVGVSTVVAAGDRWLGTISYTRGDLDQAERLSRSALDRFTEIGETAQAVLTACDLSRILAARGRFADAVVLTQGAVRDAVERAQRTVGAVLLSFARVLEDAGELEAAARIALAVQAETERFGHAAVTQTDLLQALLDRLENALGPERVAELRAGDCSLDQAIDLALVVTVDG